MPSPTETATLAPTDTATTTPVPSPTETPTEEVMATPSATTTETPVPTPTETPLATATETVTEVPTVEVTEPPVETETGTPAETPVETSTSEPLPPEPALDVFFSDNFDSGDQSSWTFGLGWAFVPGEPAGKALQGCTTAARPLRLSAMDNVVRVTVDGAEVMALRDAEPLPPGRASFNGLFAPPAEGVTPIPPANTLRVDDFVLEVPITELPSPTATLTPIPTQAAAQPTAPSNLPPGYQALVARAQRTGKIRVIVGLNVSFQAEGRLSNSQAVQSQRASIYQAQAQLLSGFAAQDATTLAAYRFIPYMALEVNEAALRRLFASPLVTSVGEDLLMRPALAESVPLIHADDAWSVGYDGSGQTAVILDTGVDASHPFLAGRIVAEACYSSNNSYDNATPLCPNGQTSQTGAGAASPQACLNGGVALGDCTHGTQVAGIAAGNGASGSVAPFNGVAPSANIIAIQVFSRVGSATYCGAGLAPCAGSYLSDQISGLEQAYALSASYPIAAVNLSLGLSKYTNTCDSVWTAYSNIVNNLYATGIATIAASGNQGYTDGLNFPACISNIVTVGATNDSDQIWSVDSKQRLEQRRCSGLAGPRCEYHLVGYRRRLWQWNRHFVCCAARHRGVGNHEAKPIPTPASVTSSPLCKSPACQ